MTPLIFLALTGRAGGLNVLLLMRYWLSLPPTLSQHCIIVHQRGTLSVISVERG